MQVSRHFNALFSVLVICIYLCTSSVTSSVEAQNSNTGNPQTANTKISGTDAPQSQLLYVREHMTKHLKEMITQVRAESYCDSEECTSALAALDRNIANFDSLSINEPAQSSKERQAMRELFSALDTWASAYAADTAPRLTESDQSKLTETVNLVHTARLEVIAAQALRSTKAAPCNNESSQSSVSVSPEIQAAVLCIMYAYLEPPWPMILQ